MSKITVNLKHEQFTIVVIGVRKKNSLDGTHISPEEYKSNDGYLLNVRGMASVCCEG